MKLEKRELADGSRAAGLQAVVDTLAAENRELQDVTARHRAENARLREQHNGDAQIIRQLDSRIAALREALQLIVEWCQLPPAFKAAGNTRQPKQSMIETARAALAVERGQK